MAELNPVITIENLSYSYPLATTAALSDISLSVNAGEFVSIIGANGAGKSTLCQAIRGLIPHFTKGNVSGTVVVNGRNVAETPIGDLARDVGYVFQNPFTQMSGVSPTVFDELAYGLGNLGVPADEMRERVEAMLKLTKLEPLRDRNPFQLSGGQQQRVALASILIMEQPILVIDEPTSQLDPETTDAMFELISAARDEGRTVVLVEHKMEKVAEFSDRVFLLEAGRLILQGSPEDVFGDPRCEQAGTRMPESMYLRRALERNVIETTPRPLSVEALIADLEQRYPQSAAASQSVEPVAAVTEVVDSPLVSLRGLHFAYPNGVQAIEDVSLDFAAGESVGIIGQNGAGKTTLAKLVNGLLKPGDTPAGPAGSITIGGESTAEWTAAQTARRVGYVFQNPDDQIFNKTVAAEVEYALNRLKVPDDERDRRVTDALALTGLSDRRDINPYDLPPSVRKFVTIASVIALNTDVVILDEPTAGQDLVGLNLLIGLLGELKARGKAIVTITHDMEFVSQNFARTVVMANRKVLLDAPTSQVFYDTAVLDEAMVDQPAFVQVADHFGDASIGLSMPRLAAAIRNDSPQP